MEISIWIWIDQFLVEIIYEGLMFSTIQVSTGSCLCGLITAIRWSFLPALAGVQIPSRVHPGEQKADEMHHRQRRGQIFIGVEI